ncbi:L-serine ammonia-lyase [Gordonia McavH-238-E]|uniref:L-serine ammonia-lyase n=1 Tax=Gordonia sp. McavH-238-E TaxID=2917736 RepID=UPI001EF4632A|nr:L-serine ammonia-lyase [Gordonia sp. McavH-238-E]MCG7632907.1 L-serine ammonia-lyase [Gordonia sp. McavH-238-E]
MTVSVFNLFSVGIGPSSSHTVGPMRAAARFAAELLDNGALSRVVDLHIDLYGSLAATGAGHGSMPAILLGLEGLSPEHSDADEVETRISRIRECGRVEIAGAQAVAFAEEDIALHPATFLERHPNALTLTVSDVLGDPISSKTYYSIGGGFVIADEDQDTGTRELPKGPFSFATAGELLALAEGHNKSISEVMLANEVAVRSDREVRSGLLHLQDVMFACQQRGLTRDGLLPGNLRVRRRAHNWYERLRVEDPHRDPAFAEDWVNLVALAVNEENAAGGRIVTAPTNGAAGIIPAVLHYARHYTPAGRMDPDDSCVRFLLTAGAIGSLYKERASISGAEVGCQGEVGSAASMAAAGLAEILGGTAAQVENAAEIAMEHSLGLTCDPIEGLVQIPCIERNAISAGKAINAARMALRGDGTHRVSLDQVIETMRATGMDMSAKYKETSTGGLAINVPVNLVEC